MDQALATKTEAPGPLQILRAQLDQRAADFRMVLPSHIKPDKFQRTVLTAAQANPELLDCDRRSFFTAAMKAAQDALLPDGREAAIVSFNTRQKGPDGAWETVRLAQYMPMVWGLRKKILQSGEITDIYANVVYRQEIESGAFLYEEGSNRTLRHKPILDPEFRPTDADIALVYSMASFANGQESFEVMRRWEIDDVREASQTGATRDKNGNPRESKGPWVRWFGEMAKKTVIRRHSKSLPQSGDIILRDVEAEDIDHAARSVVALLDSKAPEPARPLIDAGDEGVDPATGEILAVEPQADQIQPEAEPEHFIEPPPPVPIEPESEQLTESPAPGPVEFEAEPLPLTVTGMRETDAPRPEPETDELGVTVTPAEAHAEALIAKARKCEFLVDLTTLEKAAELDLAAMPPEIAAQVDAAFDQARDRLKPPKAAPAKVEP